MKMRLLLTIAITTAVTFSSAEARDGDALAGEARYSETCVNCHGPAGRGMASFPQLAGKDADYISGRLKQYRSGETVGPNSGLMIPMASDLSDDEIANLAAYLSTAPE